MDHPTAAQIDAWPHASVEHFDVAGMQIPTTQAAVTTAAVVLCVYALTTAQEATKKTAASLLATASTAIKKMQHRLAIVSRACTGVYDDAKPRHDSAAHATKLSSLEASIDQLEPFLTAIVEANEQAIATIQAQALEKAELLAQLAQANTRIRHLTQELAARAATVDLTTAKTRHSAVDRCVDALQESSVDAPASLIQAAMTAGAASQAVSVSSPVSIPEDDESEGDASDDDESEDDPCSLAGDDDDDHADEDLDVATQHDHMAFQQYVLLEDEATMEWSRDQQAANTSAFAILSDVITPDMVACSPDGLCLLPTKAASAERSPKLVAHIQAHHGLLLVGADEVAIAKLPLEWFWNIDTSELSLLERRAINMALLAPALMFWLPEFSLCQESAQKYMWFRQHLDSLMELSEEEDDEEESASHELDPSDWSDAEYMALGVACERCATKDDDSDAPTASEAEDEE